MDLTTTNKLSIPQKGISQEEILSRLEKFKSNDVPWQSGKVLAYIYEADEETKKLLNAAYTLYLYENGLDPTAFPSLLKLENDLIGMAADLLGGDEHTVGNFTSGGTESIILAVKTARDYFRHHRPEIKRPQIIVAETTHPAFHKAAHYLDVEVVMLPVDKETYRIMPQAVEAAINENTIFIMGSAPNYPFGVVDPIPELAALAKKHGIFCHVDACVGGMYLPFAKKLGYDIPPFDFSVEGVTSMSCDFHKYGYAAKGASCVLYSNDDIRRFQIYTCAKWAGYTLSNSTVLSSKTGGPMAAAWAIFHHWGQERYMATVDSTQKSTQKAMDVIAEIPELEVLGKPIMNLVAIKSNDKNVNVFEVADAMQKRGWHIQVQLASNTAQEALHLNVNAANVAYMDELLVDLKASIEDARKKALAGEVPQIDPAMFEGMLANFTPEMFDQLGAMIGMEGGSVPKDMTFVSHLLNKLPTKYRDMLVNEFMNKLFTNK